jgi:hypothetical protein
LPYEEKAAVFEPTRNWREKPTMDEPQEEFVADQSRSSHDVSHSVHSSAHRTTCKSRLMNRALALPLLLLSVAVPLRSVSNCRCDPAKARRAMV